LFSDGLPDDPKGGFLKVYDSAKVKVVCFDMDLQVFIAKGLQKLVGGLVSESSAKSSC